MTAKSRIHKKHGDPSVLIWKDYHDVVYTIKSK